VLVGRQTQVAEGLVGTLQHRLRAQAQAQDRLLAVLVFLEPA
jgi:hypothetical protein